MAHKGVWRGACAGRIVVAEITAGKTWSFVDDLGARKTSSTSLKHLPAAGPSANTSAETAGVDIHVHLWNLSDGAVAIGSGKTLPVIGIRKAKQVAK